MEKKEPGRDLRKVLQLAVESRASDIHVKPGNPPIIRIDGFLQEMPGLPKLKPTQIADMARRMMSQEQIEAFRENQEVDLAYSVAGLGRFRVNVYQQRGSVAISLRLIPQMNLAFEELMLPKVLLKIAEAQRGLVLVTGTTGSGKSTTLASIINHVNNNFKKHIITIEDPIEFLIRDKKSIISQREVGFDTPSFSQALRSSLRQDPDVILVGEMRDVETITTGVQAAETGHLVLSTLHTVDVMESINRILSFYPSHQVDHVRFELASSLKAIVSQRLLPKVDGKGRVPAVEVMINNSRIRNCIKYKEKTFEIIDAMEKGHTTDGSQTFDMSLMKHLKRGLITYEHALQNSSNPGDFALKFKGVSATSDHELDEATGASSTAGSGQKGAKGKAKGKTDKMIIERFSK